MGISIVNNIPAFSASRQFEINNINVAKTIKRLSTGLRINSAADDAAGLAISERLKGKNIETTANIQEDLDVISLYQTADGALDTVTQLIQRGIQLSVEAASDTRSNNDKKLIQTEIDQILDEISRIAHTTKFNGISLLDRFKKYTTTNIPNGFTGKIAFATIRDGFLLGSEIYSMNTDGTNQTNLSNNPSLDDWPAWSPDGTKIVFESYRNNKLGIYTMNADGTNQVKIIDNSAMFAKPAWSPDGTKIAFASDRNGGGVDEIYVMNADGTNVLQLTSNAGGGDGFPTWSPDGTKIAFASDRNGNYDIYVMNTDGTNQVRLTNSSPAASSDFPAWSPDGTKIAFDSFRVGADDIYTMNSDGTNQMNLTNNPGSVDYIPAWSPDGTKIAFTSFRDGNQEIYVSDGISQINLTNNPAIDYEPSFGGITNYTSVTTGMEYDSIFVNSKKEAFLLTDVTPKILGITDVDVVNDAQEAMQKFAGARDYVVKERAKFGAYMNRLEMNKEQEEIYKENLTAAESRITDLDMAKETTEFVKRKILTQTSSAVLAKANLIPQVILQLLTK